MNCVLTLLGDGDQAVLFRPYYFNHAMAIEMVAGIGNLVVAPTDPTSLLPDLSWLEAALDSTPAIKMVTITNPGNPTGITTPPELLRQLAELCGRRGVWLVVDNTYSAFAGGWYLSPTPTFLFVT